MHNYISEVRFCHKQLGIAPEALDCFPVTSLLRAIDIIMWTPPRRHLLFLPDLRLCLCALTTSVGSLGPTMQVCLAFGLFAMLQQSNLSPASQGQFDP